MTSRQRKGFRTAVLVILLLLVAIAAFDSRHGYLSALAETSGSSSKGARDAGTEQPGTLADRLVSPGTVPGPAGIPAGIEGAPETGRTLLQKEEPKVAGPAAPGKDTVQGEPLPPRVEEDPLPVLREPTPRKAPPANPRSGSGNDPPMVTDPVPDEQPRHDQGPAPDGGLQEGPHNDPDSDGDRDKGHGNDEDGFDEDNPGRGRSDGVGSSRGQGGGRSAGSSSGGGRSGGRGGSGSGGSKGKK